MNRVILYPAGTSTACLFASELLHSRGTTVVDHPTPEITHLLLDVPSFQADGLLRDGTDPERLLSMLPTSICVIGGNLDPLPLNSCQKLDLLRDPFYLAENAAITAECALRIAAPKLRTTFAETPVLILGWGRIGKALARLLKSFGCDVTVAARKASDRAAIQIWGYQQTDYNQLSGQMKHFRLLFNTVPHPLLDPSVLAECKNCIKVELSSADGLIGDDVIPARGLPGKLVPESSGRLIAETVFRLWKEAQK